MELYTALISFVGSFLGAGVIAFFNEKGKNLATKSDIGKITEKIESVKSNYAKEQEALRAQLNMMVNIQNNIHADLKKAIFDFWDNLVLILSLCDYTRSEFDDERLNEWQQFQKRIENTGDEMALKHARLYFLVEDEILIKLSDILISDISKYEGKFIIFLINVEPYYQQLADLMKGPDKNWSSEKYDKLNEKITELENKFENETHALMDQLDSNLDKFKIRAHQLLLIKKRPPAPHPAQPQTSS